jgi:hypothetical protein
LQESLEVLGELSRFERQDSVLTSNRRLKTLNLLKTVAIYLEDEDMGCAVSSPYPFSLSVRKSAIRTSGGGNELCPI